MPRCLAQRSTSTVSAVETWQTCTREPGQLGELRRRGPRCWPRPRPASRAARAGRRSRPRGSRRPARPAAGPGRAGRRTPSNARTYSSARRISRASATQWPSSENTRTPAAERAISPSSASSAPARPLLTAPTGTTWADPSRAAERGQVLGGLGGVGHRVGVGHGQHGGEAPARRRPSAGAHGLGVLPAGLAQVGVQVDQARAARPVRRRRSAPRRGRHRPGRRSTPSRT